MARRRGGYQAPDKPAATSGPGALSQRTDGKQPLRAYPGGDYGDRKASVQQQRGAPLPQEGGPAPGGGQQGQIPGVPVGPNGAFGPTQRPAEPLTSGVDWGEGAGSREPVLDNDPYLLLKALAQKFPHPHFDRLLAQVSEAG